MGGKIGEMLKGGRGGAPLLFQRRQRRVQDFMRDSDGIVLPDLSAARKEAVGWARDFARHNFHELIRSWKVIVTDENADVVLTMPLSEARPGKLIQAGLKFERLVSKIRSHVLFFSLAAAIMVVLVQAGLKIVSVKGAGGGYELASASTESPVFAVRFAPNASLVDITRFLDAYNGSLFEGPGPGGLYKLHVASTHLSQEEIEALIGRMAQEKVVEFVTAVQ